MLAAKVPCGVRAAQVLPQVACPSAKPPAHRRNKDPTPRPPPPPSAPPTPGPFFFELPMPLKRREPDAESAPMPLDTAAPAKKKKVKGLKRVREAGGPADRPLKRKKRPVGADAAGAETKAQGNEDGGPKKKKKKLAVKKAAVAQDRTNEGVLGGGCGVVRGACGGVAWCALGGAVGYTAKVVRNGIGMRLGHTPAPCKSCLIPPPCNPPPPPPGGTTSLRRGRSQ